MRFAGRVLMLVFAGALLASPIPVIPFIYRAKSRRDPEVAGAVLKKR
jgi:hypothetical protein